MLAEALKAAAGRCEAVLCLVSPAWLASKWCLAEFLSAKLLHKPILGLIVASVPLDQVPTEMSAEWQLCELGGGIHVETQVGGGTTVKLYFPRVIGQYRPR